MIINKEEFIDSFLFELEENIHIVETGILVLKKDPESEDEVHSIQRALHTIKGAARMLKFSTIEQIAHGAENIFKGLKEERYTVTRPLIQLTFLICDYLREGLRLVRETRHDDFPVQHLLKVFEKAYSNEPYDLTGVEIRPSGEDGSRGVVKTGLFEEASPPREDVGITPTVNEKSGGYNTIRIKTDTVDKIIKSLNNLIIKQFQLKKENDAIHHLEESVLTLVALAGGEGSPRVRKQKEDCIKQIQNLKKDFNEKIELIEMNTFEVQEEIFSLRMLPLDLILGSLGKMVEETAIKLGKEVLLTVEGSEVMLDKTVLEKINDPLIHLVRNAIDHGLESTEERLARGKPGEGSIHIRCYPEGGNIVIRIKDDGAGIDYDNIRKKAAALYPSREEEIRKMSNENLNTYLFMPGFTTKEKVTSLSGRGVGLDIVGYNIEKIKGKVFIESKLGEGTEFILTLPLSLATVEGFFVAAGKEVFLIPSNFTRELLIIKREEVFDLLNKKAIRLRDKVIPVYYLSSIINNEAPREDNKCFVIVVESLGEIIGIIVDTIIQYASLIYKPLPRSLSRLKAIQGIVFDESFNIINILYIPEIINRFKSLRNIDSQRRYSVDKEEFKHILVVDDSYSTREIEKSALELENYNVTTAVDGIDALEKVKEQYFHLIVTDINMPRMDGLLLVENLRRDERYKETPIIVVSSENERDVKERFLNVGANSFIVKSEFDRNTLISEVKSLLY